ncbi:MAG: transketolase family protein [bacterium]
MSNLSTREAYGNALVRLAEANEFYVLDADLSKATQTARFESVYPERFFNLGIAEADMMSTAAGMATCEKLIFASSFAMFATGRAYEQIRNSIAYPNLSVVIAATHSGILVAEDGASHQAIEDIALMRVIPGMTVIVPCDEIAVNACMEFMLEHKSPIYFRLGRAVTPAIYDKPFKFELGKGNVLKDGTDITIMAIGDMVSEALLACEELEKQGISTAVIDMMCVKPIDKDLIIEYAKKTGHIITIEDHNIIGGLGSAVAEVLADNSENIESITKFRRLGVKDIFGKSGKRDLLKQEFGLDFATIVSNSKELLNK